MMRKFFLLLVPVVAVMLFASCKKDYDCECVTMDGATRKSTNIYTITDTKKNAEKRCEESGSKGGPGTDLTVTCTATKRL